MLKISVVDRRTQRRLIVEGKLIAPWVKELKSACEDARADLHGRDLVVEMKQVTSISQEGENGIPFRGHGVFTKHVLKELTRRASEISWEMKR